MQKVKAIFIGETGVTSKSLQYENYSLIDMEYEINDKNEFGFSFPSLTGAEKKNFVVGNGDKVRLVVVLPKINGTSLLEVIYDGEENESKVCCICHGWIVCGSAAYSS